MVLICLSEQTYSIAMEKFTKKLCGFIILRLRICIRYDLIFSVSSAISSGDSTDQVAEQPAPNHTTLKAQREQQIELFALIFAKIITGVLCTAGILANLINVTVLTRSWMVYSTNVYLTAVAVCDLAYLVFSALFSLQLYARMRTSWLYMNALPFIYGSANSFSNTTTWLTVGFTVERYIAISSPIWGHRMCTRRRARTVVYVTVTICLLLTLPDYFSARIDAPVSETELVSQTDSNDSKQHRRGEYRVTQNTTVSNFVESFGYTYINQACFLIVPLILLLVFNLLLIRSVYQASRERKNLTRADTCKAYSLTSGGAILSSSTVPRYNLSTMHRPGIKASLDADTSTQLEAAKPVKFDRARCNQVGSGTFLTGGNPETNTGGLRRPILGEQHRITIMLIAIVMAFIVLQLPSIFPIIINAVVKIEVNVNSELLHFRSLYVRVSNTLLLVNAAMNFSSLGKLVACFLVVCAALLRKKPF
ncbi:unnamed protein product [Protopolystoma xenopodis]|uniref:G-protein coupled receptors family 1 profile domain-containing protein n=1 Tax=Protopolystoma xenopodis TaxID=117903 RepID=A0A3S5A948_9PLAT|nr:unnamed protein product [Protopolystoma xenopodis]